MTKEEQKWVDSLSTEKLIEILESIHLRQTFYRIFLSCLLPVILLCFVKNVIVQIVSGIIIVIMFVRPWLFLYLRRNDYNEYFTADKKIDEIDDLENALHDRYKSATEKERTAIANYFFRHRRQI